MATLAKLLRLLHLLRGLRQEGCLSLQKAVFLLYFASLEYKTIACFRKKMGGKSEHPFRGNAKESKSVANGDRV